MAAMDKAKDGVQAVGKATESGFKIGSEKISGMVRSLQSINFEKPLEGAQGLSNSLAATPGFLGVIGAAAGTVFALLTKWAQPVNRANVEAEKFFSTIV